MLTVLRQRNFGLLWTAGFISLLGDWVLYAVFPFYIARVTDSALATGAMALIELLPNLVLGAVVGVLIDRWNPKKTMITADLLRALALVPLFLVHSAGLLWLVYVVAFTESSISVFFSPAKAVLLRQVVIDEDLMTANSLSSISDNACRLIGPIIGGGLFLLLGFSILVLADILSYALSALLVTGIVVAVTLPRIDEKTERAQSREETAEEEVAKDKLSLLVFWRQWVLGMQLMRQERWLIALCVCMAVAMLGQGTFNALLAIFGEQVVKMNSEFYGWYLSAQGIGGLIGGFIVARFGKAFRPSHVLAISLGVSGLLLLLQFNLPLIPVALVTSGLVGIFVVGLIVSLQTILQRGVDPAYLGRVMSTYGTTQMAALLIGTFGGSLLGQFWGIVPVLNLAAGLLLLASVGSLLWLGEVGEGKAEASKVEMAQAENEGAVS